MPDTIYSLIDLDSECRSAEAAHFLAQIRDGHQRLRQITEKLTPEALAWQLAPGVNTVGMLLAHVALSEVHLVHVGVEGAKTSRLMETLGLGPDDDGMPLDARGTPPQGLAGRDLPYFHGLLDKAFAETEVACRRLGDEDLDRRIVRPLAQGGERVLNVRWTLNHILEHLVTHRGQIGLLIHLRERAT